MAYKLRVTSVAAADFSDALTWYQEHSEQVAARFAEQYIELIEAILENPFWYGIAKGKIRCAVFGRTFPYSIYFRVEGDCVRVLSVFHHKRSPTRWQKRH